MMVLVSPVAGRLIIVAIIFAVAVVFFAIGTLNGSLIFDIFRILFVSHVRRYLPFPTAGVEVLLHAFQQNAEDGFEVDGAELFTINMKQLQRMLHSAGSEDAASLASAVMKERASSSLLCYEAEVQRQQRAAAVRAASVAMQAVAS